MIKCFQFITFTRFNLESELSNMRILDNNSQKPVIRMANLCVVSSHAVNGVAQLTPLDYYLSTMIYEQSWPEKELGHNIFLLVADTQAGSLIGKQGSTIKSIQDGYGCIICVLGSDDNVVEVQGDPAGVHKAVEVIAVHLHVRVNHNAPPHQPWVPLPQRFSAPGGDGPAFVPPSQQYMPPSHPYDNYYPTTDLPPMDKQFHQAPLYAYGRDPSAETHPPSAQP
ncbi:hypothetical protein AHAS_Ahas01G0074100 [Arachis hypogaea]